MIIPRLGLFWNHFFLRLGTLLIEVLIMERVNQRTNHLLGENIKRLRIEQGLRNRDIVAKLQIEGVEISASTYSKVEMGLNNPSVDMLIALTKIFKCDYNEFFKMK